MTHFSLRHLACALALLGAPGWAAYADTRTVPGHSLTLVAAHMDEAVSINPDPSLVNSIRVIADEPCLSVTQADSVVVSADGCSGDVGTVSISVPTGTPITIASNGDGDIHIGETLGMLTANLTANGDMTVARVAGRLVINDHANSNVTIEEASGETELTATSSGDIRIRRLNGTLRSSQHGSGDLTIGEIESPMAELTVTGSGDAALGHGNIRALRARLSGSGDLNVAATVGTADLDASGGGDIRVANATGEVHRNSSGDSTISVGGMSGGLGALAIPPIPPIPPLTGLDDLTVHVGHRGGSAIGHVVAAVIVCFILFFIWRTLQRNGGIAALRGRYAGPAMPAAPTHPGVIAVRDAIARLDSRLARVETYVTSREFDLHRKFRELDTR
jgi:hypothetical protein